MRFIVTYTKPDQIEGSRLFDVIGVKPEVTDRIREIAQQVAGPGATVKSVKPNDGKIPE